MRKYITKNVLIFIFAALLLSMGVGYSQRTLKNDEGLWYREQKIAVAEYSEVMTTIGGYIFLGRNETKSGDLLSYWIEIEHHTPLYNAFGIEMDRSEVLALELNNVRFPIDENVPVVRKQAVVNKTPIYKDTMRIALSLDLFEAIISAELWEGSIYTNAEQHRIELWIFDTKPIHYQLQQLQ